MTDQLRQRPRIDTSRNVGRTRVLLVALLAVAASCDGTSDTTAPSTPAATDQTTLATDPDPGTPASADGPTTTAVSTTTAASTTTEAPFVPEPLTIELLAELDPLNDGPYSAVVLDDWILTKESPPAFPDALVAYDRATGAVLAQELTYISQIATTASGTVIGFDLLACEAQVVDPVDLSVGIRFPSVGDGRSCSGSIVLVRDEQVWITERDELYALDTTTATQQQVQWPFEEGRGGVAAMWDLGDAVLVELFGQDRFGVARIGPDLVVERFVELPGQITEHSEGFRVESDSDDEPVTFPLDPSTLELGEPIDPVAPGECDIGDRTTGVNGEVWIGPVRNDDESTTMRLCIDEQLVAEGSGDLGGNVVHLAVGDAVAYLFVVEYDQEANEVTGRRLYRVERG